MNITENSSKGLNWRQTFLIGLGFFTTGISWALYNSYVPLWLKEFIPDNSIIGLIMGFDNLAMIFMEPLVGNYSDNTKTRFGRRMPFLLIGIPLSAFFLFLLPFFRTSDLIPLMAVIISFLLMMAFYRAPVVALMPDVVSSKYRTKANGIINLMGGLGSVYAFAFGSMLYEKDPIIAFGSTSIIMLLALALLFFFVKEPSIENIESTIDDNITEEQEVEKVSLVNSLSEIFSGREKTALFIFFAIFFWFLGYNALETWFTNWAKTTLPYLIDIVNIGTEEAINSANAKASFMLTLLALFFVIFAIPSGYLGHRKGRAFTIKIGLPFMIFFLFLAYLIGQFNILGSSPATQYWLLVVVLAFAGIGWALININSIVITWELATDSRLGSYTGLYYLFSSSAAVIGPGAVGLIFDIFGGGEFYLLFPLSLLSFIIAFILMFGVKKGEAKE